jgi:hypothetical protein
MTATDNELAEIAQRHARTLGCDNLEVVSIAANEAAYEVLLGDPTYARGGGVILFIDDRGVVIRAVPQL